MFVYRTCKYCHKEATSPEALIDFCPSNASAYGRRNLCKLCETTLKTMKNNNIKGSIVGEHTKIAFPFRISCSKCGLVVKVSYLAPKFFSRDSRTYSGFKTICKQCEEQK